MTSLDTGDRLNVLRQTDHWQRAIVRLGSFDDIAAPAAWASLEPEVATAIKESFRTALDGLTTELSRVRRRAERCAAHELSALSDRIGVFRQHYVRTERALAFYGDAINSRTNPVMQCTLLGLDRIARLSMRRLLDPLGKDTPMLLTYVDSRSGRVDSQGRPAAVGADDHQPGRRGEDRAAQPDAADRADSRDRASGGAHPRLERGTGRGAAREPVARTRRSWPRSGRAGPPRSPPTPLRSSRPATRRSPTCTTCWPATATTSSASCPAIRIRSRISACC